MIITAGPQIYAVQAAARPATAEHACARTHSCTAPNVAKVEWRDIGHSVLGGQGPGRPMRQAQATRLPQCWPCLLPLHRHIHTGDLVSLFRQNRHCNKPVFPESTFTHLHFFFPFLAGRPPENSGEQWSHRADCRARWRRSSPPGCMAPLRPGGRPRATGGGQPRSRWL